MRSRGSQINWKKKNKELIDKKKRPMMKFLALLIASQSLERKSLNWNKRERKLSRESKSLKKD